MKPAVFFVFVICLCGATPAFAEVEEPTLPRDDGPLLTLGLGNNYGLLGLELAYSFRVPGTLYHVAPHAGAGLWGSGAAAVGVRGGWGLRHRIIADVGYGPLGSRYVYLHRTRLRAQLVYGAMLAVGYEYVANWGFVFRVSGGAGYALDYVLGAAGVGMVLNLGIGFKLW